MADGGGGFKPGNRVKVFYDKSTRDDVLRDEHALISARRPEGNPVRFLETHTVRRPSDGDPVGGCYDTVGLALSGGGVRSASFCTGVLQGLSLHNVLPKIDYLSTVSGGGYVAAAMNVSMARNGGEFPFLSPKHDEKTDSASMQQLRDNANYLKFGDPLQMLFNVAIYLRGFLANIFYVAPIILFLAAITLLLNPDFRSLSDNRLLPEMIRSSHAITFVLLLCSAGLFAVWSIAQARSQRGELTNPLLKYGAYALVAVAFFAFVEWQPLIVKSMFWFPTAVDPLQNSKFLATFLNAIPTWIAPFIAAVSYAANYLGEILKKTEHDNGQRALLRKLSTNGLILAAGLALPFLLWISYLMLVAWGIDVPKTQYDARIDVPHIVNLLRGHIGPSTAYGGINMFAMLYLAVALVMGLFWPFLTPNGNSLHRLYRDRLSGAFCFYFSGGKLQSADDIKLTELQKVRPFHIVNTALNVQDSPEVNKKGRDADFFVFTPLYTGSAATGYVKTEVLEQPDGLTGERALDFATAIAISGAAASSNMGKHTMKMFSLPLALLNVRLGYWFPNPKHLARVKTGMLRNLQSICCFIYEAFGKLNVERNTIYLTDGGHIENLGAYELLRRRCQLIIVVDAEADSSLNFTSLVTLQRYARIDLGIRINLPWSEIRKVSLAAQRNAQLSSPGPHCAIGRIEYDHGGTGVLLYIKSSVTGDENDYVRDYNRRYIEFPHQTTSDQFFSEEQFEVYRALGYHIMNGLLQGDQLVQTTSGELESLRDVNAKGFGVRLLADILGVAALPQALLPKRIKEKSEFKPQAVAA